MRVVLFIGSPLESIDQAELIKIAKKMKKEKVQADVVMFGDNDEEAHEKFNQFVETLNGKEGSGSSLIVVPTGSSLTDALMSSSIFQLEDGSNGGVAGGAGGGYEFGVDAENDPDLALALRVSMEEERARQAAAAGGVVEENNGGAEQAAVAVQQSDEIDMGAMTEEQQLEWALRLSMQDNAPVAQAPAAASNDDEKMDVDVTGTPTPDNLDELMNNPELLQQIVDDLPAGEQKKEDEKKE
ncbi:unnamed protein product [Caenorhabditis angaria]|uniref:26S proteasome non-ATPase regulatory subunit 4 n=1 Tax=Caenorhabditis angaria TaxID=860376 RepID=A0A9P1I301_9PELO|nr:unnamed protein product [Caenorhabditis angaria]